MFDPALNVPLDHAPIAISVSDASHTVVQVNDAFRTLFGHADSDPVGGHIDVAAPSSDAALASEIRRRLLDGEVQIFRTTQRFELAGGTSQPLNVVVAPMLDRAGNRTGLITTYDFSIPDRPIEDDSYLQRVLAASQSSLLTLDSAGVVHSTGGRHGDALGYPVEFWHGRPFVDVVVDEDRRRFERFLADLVDDPGQPHDLELSVRAADGSARVILASASNLLNDPAVTAIVMSFQDVSELHDRITGLVEQRRAAEGLARDRADMIATVSHELRNPLHALQGLAEILATSELPADLNEVAHELHSQLSGLASVTSDLLDAARAERDAIVLHPVPTEVAAILDRGLQYGRAAIGTKPVEIKGFLESNTPEAVMIDGARVDQIMRNLVGNAAKFTERGSINVTIGPIAHGLHITVADSGNGIPQADLSRILEPFARGSNSSEASGAGLGLAIVNDLARAMEGGVSVDSRVGRGSTFRVELRAPKSLSAPPPPRAVDDLHSCDVTVLVVDDDHTNRVIASRQLERFGCTVVTAQSGEEAIEMMRRPVAEFGVDVVLMDRRMPGIDGATATLELRKIPDRRDVYVIGLTASASAEEQAECAAATMDAFVAKPASLFDLYEAIDGFVRRPTAIDASTQPRTEAPAVAPSTVESGLEPGLEPGIENGNATATESGAGAVDSRHQVDPSNGALLVDRERVRELVVEFDDVQLVRHLLEMFGSDLAPQVDEMRAAQRAGDLTTVNRVAHTIKGSAAMLGAKRLEVAARTIESSPGDDLTEFARLAIDTADELTRVRNEVDLVGEGTEST